MAVLRVVERARRVLVALPLKSCPASFCAEFAPRSQELFVRAFFFSSVVHHNYRSPGTASEVRILVVDEDELGAAMLEDIRHFAMGETRIYRA